MTEKEIEDFIYDYRNNIIKTENWVISQGNPVILGKMGYSSWAYYINTDKLIINRFLSNDRKLREQIKEYASEYYEKHKLRILLRKGV